ncbi:MAG TPA: ATP-binding protein [Hyphomonas sp.]|nr:AAA family ATPase [Hyphomonas sp.]HRI99806.1 ATP-binding protein [Hyphomonas sp.]HRK34609.1 ATP-binding protein [Candidatus Hydrogenedentota bacterium]
MPTEKKPGRPTPRHAEARILRALGDTRIVALVGPRQSGKTTLARKIAAARGMTFVTLDDEQFRQFANDDPSGFMRSLDRAVIDEIQRAPSLILALKKTVDEDPRQGRFLITGSVDLFKGMLSPDSLAGRVETIELLPFSQSEIARTPPSGFLDRSFSASFPPIADTGRTPDLIVRVLRGGYPEALARSEATRRRDWLRDYARALALRDAAELAAVSKTAELSRLLERAALASGELVNLSALASPLGIDSKTADRWLTLLEQMFVLRRVRAWHTNELKRLVKTPKVHFLDTGLLAALRRVGADEIDANRQRLGPLLEGFVFSELVKQASLTSGEVYISHYRDKDQIEVDFVLERRRQIVGVEVKAAATVKPEDFRGLRRLKDATGNAFVCGIVLHDGERIQKVGEGLYAMPIQELWVTSARR